MTVSNSSVNFSPEILDAVLRGDNFAKDLSSLFFSSFSNSIFTACFSSPLAGTVQQLFRTPGTLECSSLDLVLGSRLRNFKIISFTLSKGYKSKLKRKI